MPGVRQVEGLRAVAARVRHEHRSRDVALVGVPEGATLRRILERSGSAIPVPPDGLLATAKLGEVLGLRVLSGLEAGAAVVVHPGDRVKDGVTVEALE